MQIFVPTSTTRHDMRKGRGRGREGTWKVDTHVTGDDNENISRIINNYSMNVLPGSTNSIG